MACELCKATSETLLWRGQNCRVILIDDTNYPGFCRIVWNEHIKEMSDLPPPMREELMNTVFAVEKAIRVVMQPDKINLASLGNMVPHLHWHVIPRYIDDPHFPNPVWTAPLRPARITNINDIQQKLGASILENLSC